MPTGTLSRVLGCGQAAGQEPRLRVSALLFYWLFDLVTNHISGLKLATRTLLLLSEKRPNPDKKEASVVLGTKR